MSSGSEAMSEQSSSVREGAGYDEVYPLGRGPEEGLTWSLEREPSAHSPNEEEEEDYEADGGEDREEVEEGEGGEERKDKEEESDEGGHEESDEPIDQTDEMDSRPFILPKIWTVNDFYPTISQRVFNTLRDRH